MTNFDPNGVGLKNGHFIGLPFSEADAGTVLLSVPWDVTVSASAGTSTGPQNILDCSSQLDLFDADMPEAWKSGIYFRPPNEQWKKRNEELRPLAKRYIDFLENGGNPGTRLDMKTIQTKINEASEELNNWVFRESKKLLEKGKRVGVVGGEHSVPLGFLEALAGRHEGFGVLQIDAHQDLREAYEGFTFSHASIFHNALKIKQINKLVQVGIRDHCEAEMALAKSSEGRIEVWPDQQIRERVLAGKSFAKLCKKIIAPPPHHVYVSFDIDGLSPGLCPNTGTPVPGGLHFGEAMLLLKTLAGSGRQIIGFDLCEVAGTGNDWDGNVGARVLYKLCNFMTNSLVASG